MDPTQPKPSMADVRAVAAGVVAFLKRQLDDDAMNADARESVEVAAQCVETAFELAPDDASRAPDLLRLYVAAAPAPARPAQGPPQAVAEISDEARAEAERAKNEGNDLMRADKPREALERYSRAIALDPLNAVYFSNRAAAQFKLGAHEAAVADCTAALALQPDYSKALGRMGLALRELGRVREARQAFARALQLEPDNESYRENLRQAERQAEGARAPPELAGLLQNPALLSMATDMLADPNMQSLIAGLMGGAGGAAGGAGAGAAGGAGVGALLEAGQALAQHMQAANPELVDALRRRLQQPPAP